ncbi:ubiquinone biosynthesis protein UbiE [Methyloprofundus sedimenti]|uniref:Ubiquinone biosynthesis protein UbiE n=1 Tax=Methyloprofundus sedimenti TaxID=1420851 RepID=A0A1V8M1Q7_9GAMM|nr:class I SAM-dependent methyltransferase [Methyloprofundus sedimenti]OQK15462.1 ubiquinone biosynthesis protein UbiE [Methyloprofundus sedimenti]
MSQHEIAKAKAVATYNTAADYFDHPVSSFWHCFGRQTIERIALRPGESVLDVCSGSGGSALPAAEQVGPHGKVIAADLAERLIALAEAKARVKKLENIEFRVADMLDLGYPDSSFDAVVCVFGIFFVPDMTAAVKELWRMVKPGGRLAITTWGPDLFEPADTIFWDAIGNVRVDLQRSFNPWDRISKPSGLGELFVKAGIDTHDIQAVSGMHSLNSADDWWAIAMGSGYRGTLAQLDAETFEQVRNANLSCLYREQVKSIKTNVVYAVATKR